MSGNSQAQVLTARQQYKKDHQNNMRKVAYTLRALLPQANGTYGSSFQCKTRMVQATDKFNVNDLQMIGSTNWATNHGYECDFVQATVTHTATGTVWTCDAKKKLVQVLQQQQQQQQAPQPVQQQQQQQQQAPQPIQQQPIQQQAPPATVQSQQGIRRPRYSAPPGRDLIQGRDSLETHFDTDELVMIQFPDTPYIRWSTTSGGPEDRKADFSMAGSCLTDCLIDPPDHSQVRVNGYWYYAGNMRRALRGEISVSDVLPVAMVSDSGALATESSGNQWEGLEPPADNQLVAVPPASPQLPAVGDNFLADFNQLSPANANAVASSVNADTALGTQVDFSSLEESFNIDDWIDGQAFELTNW